jgi:hypothetical protein
MIKKEEKEERRKRKKGGKGRKEEKEESRKALSDHMTTCRRKSSIYTKIGNKDCTY